MGSGCLACNLTAGRTPPPGGRLTETAHWVVEHCVGPLGVGTVIVKPFRHVVHLWELSVAETAQLGPLLVRVSGALSAELEPDQVYVNLWSHAGWEPGHIHFVLQPVWREQQRHCANPGPALQAALFRADEAPDPAAVADVCERLRRRLAASERAGA